MQTATITVKYKNPPKTPKGPGSVKDANGIYWKVWPAQLPEFEENKSYTVGYTTEQYNGKDQYTVREIAPAQTNGVIPSAPAPAGQSPLPTAAGRGTNSQVEYTKPTNARDAERMFCCGLVGHALAAAQVQFTVTDVTAAINIARDVWNNSFGKEG